MGLYLYIRIITVYDIQLLENRLFVVRLSILRTGIEYNPAYLLVSDRDVLLVILVKG